MFKVGAGRDELGAEQVPQLFGKPDALQFAGLALWDLTDNENLPRHLVVREANGYEVTKLKVCARGALM